MASRKKSGQHPVGPQRSISSGSSPKKHKLRLITYLVPGIPVGLFELIRDYLEEMTGIEACLIYESRWTGPRADRTDPFECDLVDLAFLNSTSYLRMKKKGSKFVELCKAAPMHAHPMALGRPVYYSEVIVLKENQDRYKDFDSLKGCNWCYSDENSLSGNHVMLAALKKHGFNATFFGNAHRSGSHLNSLKAVLSGQVDTAAVDSSVVAGFEREHPEQTDRIHKVLSLGPMPIYPLVFNSRLCAELKDKITDALLHVAERGDWGQRLQDYGVLGYTQVDETFYDMEKDIEALVKNMSVNPAYY